MITNLQPYSAMKDSGVPWLGEVPEHWEVRRLRNAADMRVSNIDKNTKDGEGSVRLCNYVDVYKNERITDRVRFMGATATSEEVARFRLERGDLLITKDSESWTDIGVPALVEYAASDLVCGYHLALLRPFHGLMDGGYLLRALQSPAVAYQFHVEANGVTRYGLSHAAIKSVLLPLPPLSEQAAIVRLLDYADRKIRRYIRAKQKLIKLLEEQKQVIIHHAVTRGLDPKVRLKPSGVEWLGDVPEHWEVKKLRLLFRYAKGRRAAELTNEYIGRHPGLFTVYSGQTESNGLMGQIDWYEFDFSHPVIFVTTVGARAMSTRVVSGKFSLSQNCALIIPRAPQTNALFFERVLQRAFSYERATISLIMQPSLRFTDLNRFYVPCPPVSEQEAIANAITESMNELDAVQDRAHREISLLREYRTRLITDVVTGKLDVREAAASLPEELEEEELAGGIEEAAEGETTEDAELETEALAV